MDTFLFLIFPYLCLAVFVVGHYWRYKYDKFGWTTRSSQLYENRLLRWGSPLFHFGLLGVIGGHVIGLVVPKSWTEALGISEDAYHLVAVVGGLIAGAATLLGLVILIYRDDVYNKDPNNPDAGTAELIIAKQRNGPTGTVKLAFLREQTRFANLAAGG